MRLARLVLVNTAVQYTSKALIIFLSLFVTSQLTRHLGKEIYGQLSLITTTFLFFANLTDWGIQSTSIREASHTPRSAHSIYSQSIFLKSILALLAFLLYLLTVILYPPFQDFRFEAILSSILLLFISLRTTSLVIHHSRLNMVTPALTEILTNLTLFLVIIYANSNRLTLTLGLVVLAIIVGSALNSLLTFLPISKYIFPLNLNLSSARKLFLKSLPMGAFLVIFSIYNRLDTYIIQYFHGASEVGTYTLAYKIHENLVLGAALLMNTLFPLLSHSPDQAKRIFVRALPIILLGALLVLILGQFISPSIIQILGGSQWLDSLPLLRILLFATFVSYLNHLTGFTLISLGLQLTTFKLALAALVFNLATNLIFVPYYSSTASAIITILTESLMLISTTFILLRRNFFRP